MEGLIHRIRRNYSDCTTLSLRENRCRLQLNAVPADFLVVIDGTKYQANKGFTAKLCDGILFCGRDRLFVAAVELKGGSRIRLSEAIEQIQGGLTVANDILVSTSGVHLVAEWVPALVYSGGIHSDDTNVLRNTQVWFQGAGRAIEKHDCGTRLSDILLEDFEP